MGKTLKKLGMLALAAGLTVSLAACGNNSSKDKTVKISILQGKVEVNKQLKQIASAYEKKHPNVKITVQSIGGGTQYDPVLKTRIASDNAPAIFSLDGPASVKKFSQYTADLTNTKLAKNAVKGTLGAVTSNGKVYGVPFNIEGYGLVYNKSVFKKAGIDPSSLTTYAKLKAAVQKLDSQKDNLGIKAVFATAGKETWQFSDHLANLYIGQQFDGNASKLYKSKTMKFSKNQEMKQMLDLMMQYSVKPVMQVDYSAQVNKYFSEGKVAMIEAGDWIYPTVQSINSKFASNGIGMIPIPVKGYEGKYPVGTSIWWAVNKQASSKVQKASKDFLTWLYTSKQGKKYVVNKLQFVPAYKGYDSFKMSEPLTQTVFNASKEGKTIGWAFPAYTGTSWDPDKFQVELQKYMSGKQSWNKTVTNSIQEWKTQQESE